MTTATDKSAETIEAINRFNTAFNRHDVSSLMKCMTDDCIFESTAPPDGQRFEGQEAVGNFWHEFFQASPDAFFEGEDMFASDDRCTVRWIYHYSDSEGQKHRLRGVDVFKVRDGKVHEKLAYVKG